MIAKSLQKDYEALSSNIMWQKYRETIVAYRDGMMKELLSCPVDKVEDRRGNINALNYAIGLPESILRSSDKNQNFEGEDNG